MSSSLTLCQRETNRKDVCYSELTVATSAVSEKKCERGSIVREQSLSLLSFFLLPSSFNVILRFVSGRTSKKKKQKKKKKKINECDEKCGRERRNKIRIDLSLFNHDKQIDNRQRGPLKKLDEQEFRENDLPYSRKKEQPRWWYATHQHFEDINEKWRWFEIVLVFVCKWHIIYSQSFALD